MDSTGYRQNCQRIYGICAGAGGERKERERGYYDEMTSRIDQVSCQMGTSDLGEEQV